MKLPEVVPVSDMANKQQSVLAMSDEAPVILASRSKARAVLVSIKEWNHIQDLLAMYRAYVRTESDRMQLEETEWIDADPLLDKWAAKHRVIQPETTG